MLKCDLIGHLGADAQVVEYEGKKFAKMRVADSETYKDSAGVKHETTRWIDVTIYQYDGLLPYLKKGTLLYVRGNLQTRVYSSEKDKCMKCGMSVMSTEVRLLSASKSSSDSSNTGDNGQTYNGF